MSYDIDYEEQPVTERCFRRLIEEECDRVKQMLLEKNKSYGNSAFSPIGVFSKHTAREGLLIRIDDKLKRIQCGAEYPGDDTKLDLIGYMILLQVLDRSNMTY